MTNSIDFIIDLGKLMTQSLWYREDYQSQQSTIKTHGHLGSIGIAMLNQ